MRSVSVMGTRIQPCLGLRYDGLMATDDALLIPPAAPLWEFGPAKGGPGSCFENLVINLPLISPERNKLSCLNASPNRSIVALLSFGPRVPVFLAR